MTKADLRRELRASPALDAQAAARRSGAICDQIRAHSAWEDAQVCALYSASAHEPALDDLISREHGRKRFCFPRVEGSGLAEERLAFYEVLSQGDLLDSRWGLREPAPNPENRVPIEVIDFIVVPGVAFTAAGDRLGRGRAHYDRFLQQVRPDAAVVGVCFRERLLPEIPSEPHDLRVHQVISA